ncbi:MAG: alpha/beta hydrolase [Clostridia bacterium]|nr:alpha/beta hydrolase [Clostridia bacterium]
MSRVKKKWLTVLAGLVLLVTVAFVAFLLDYYRADETAVLALKSDHVTVNKTAYGWFLDGPSEDTALIFYPGARVEETAYAPLLHRLAENGMDVCLLKMPFRLASFDADRAGSVMQEYDYAHWYVGGHSLGGAIAANFAVGHGQELDGVILLAAYPSKPLDQKMTEILLYGSEDKILNRKRLEEGKAFAPAYFVEHVISGGNHAQFGNYGAQRGDGEASVSAEEQQRETVEVILRTLMEKP